MLIRCARTPKQTQYAPANCQSYLRQLRIGNTRYQHTTNELPTNPSESTADSEPWKQILDTPINHWRAKNVVPGDLHATIEAHKLARIVRKIKSKPRELEFSDTGNLYNVDGIRVGGRPTTSNKDSLHGIRRPELDALKQPIGDPIVYSHNKTENFEEQPLVKPSPSTEELELREYDSDQDWKERPPNDQPLDDVTTYSESYPDRLVGDWVRHSGQIGGDPQRPWLKLTNTDIGDGLQRQVRLNRSYVFCANLRFRLTAEIQAFENYMTLTQAEKRAAQATIILVKSVARKCGLENQLSFHGSRCTGLANPYSDLDVHFAIPKYERRPGERGPSPSRPKAKKAGLNLLFHVYRVLSRLPMRMRNVELIHARIPLVVGFDNHTKIKFQCMALTPVRSSLDFTAYYLSVYPNLRPLFFLLRQALEMRGLNVVKEGGLGSYPLFIMILTALNHDVGHIPKDDLASQLLQVLRFWSEADLHNNGYSADPPRVFPKVNKKKTTSTDGHGSFDDIYARGIEVMRKHYPEQPFLLCLQDPGNPINDLGRKTWHVRRIQQLFRRAHEKIVAKMDEYEKIQTAEQRRNWTHGILDCLVRGAYGEFEKQRLLVEDRFQTSKPWQPPHGDTDSVVMTDSAQPFRVLKHAAARPF